MDTPPDDGIEDLPSLRKMRKDAQNMATVKRIMPFCRPFLKLLGIDVKNIDEALSQADELVYELKKMSETLEQFNSIFASRGWITYDLLNFEVAQAAIAKAKDNDVEGAEADLVNYYSVETVRWKLQSMQSIKAFQARIPLARKALSDYEAERYHACIPVVLALLDGLVNELHNKRRGFFSAEIDLIAWDSLSAHSTGLNELTKLFQVGRYKTTTEPILIPYRNGIMHGMDLGYDTKMVAAKTWAALFSTSDWARKSEAGLLEAPPEQPHKTWDELLHMFRENRVKMADALKWKPRNIILGSDVPISGSPDMFNDGTPEKRLAEYLTYWKVRNYGYMANYLSPKLGPTQKLAPLRIKQTFDSKRLSSFEFISIQDKAAAFSIIPTKLVFEEYGEEVTKTFDFRLINENPEGDPEIWETPGSEWKIISWALY